MNLDRELFEPKVWAEIEGGNLPRAKQILQGRFRKGMFNTKLLESYGSLLLAMGETSDAGVYLFSSGVRKPEYNEALSKFGSSHNLGDIQQFKSLLPMMVRYKEDSFIERLVSEDFFRNGFTEEEIEEINSKYELIYKKSNSIGCFWTLLIPVILLLWLAS